MCVCICHTRLSSPFRRRGLAQLLDGNIEEGMERWEQRSFFAAGHYAAVHNVIRLNLCYN